MLYYHAGIVSQCQPSRGAISGRDLCDLTKGTPALYARQRIVGVRPTPERGWHFIDPVQVCMAYTGCPFMAGA